MSNIDIYRWQIKVAIIIGLLAASNIGLWFKVLTADPVHLVYDQVTREQWQTLGWGTDPTEKPHQAGDYWCKTHIDGNGDHCEPSYRPK